MKSRRITRVKMPAIYADLRVERTRTGARITVGTTHFHLSAAEAVRLADTLVDATEKPQKETPNV